MPNTTHQTGLHLNLPSPLAREGLGVRGSGASRRFFTLTPALSRQGRGSHSSPLSPCGRGAGGEGLLRQTTLLHPHPNPLPSREREPAEAPGLQPPASSLQPPASSLQPRTRRGFTLIELMVTIGIILILATLTMLAMAGAQEAAQIAKTKSLIARLNVLIMQKYESYRNRQLPIQLPIGVTARQAAAARCDAVRQLMRMEMPDRWSDIVDPAKNITIIADSANSLGGTTISMPAPSVWQAYFSFYNYVLGLPGYSAPAADGGAKAGDEFQGAKTLYLIVTMGLEENDVLENFNTSEIKDYDNTGCKVFIDAWGRPIRFLRWAPGFMANPATGAPAGGFSGVSRLQTGWDRDQTDPTGVYGSPPPVPAGVNPATLDQPATGLTTSNTYALYPLIFSAGPDGYYDIVTDSSATLHYANSVPPNDPFYSVKDTTDFPKGPVGTPSAIVDNGQTNNTYSHYDNIHNHNLGTR